MTTIPLRIDAVERLTHQAVIVTMKGPVMPPEAVPHVTVTMRMRPEEAEYGDKYEMTLVKESAE